MGRGLGIAFHYSDVGHFAEVAEVSVASVDGTQRIQVHQVWVVGDIGPIVDLSSVENQCQGCIVDALSTMMLELTMEGGQIEQKNFDRCPVARFGITPPVDVHLLPTDHPPSGVGEPAFPPLAPAVCNAGSPRPGSAAPAPSERRPVPVPSRRDPGTASMRCVLWRR